MQDHNLNPIMTNRLHLDPPSLRGPSSHHLLGTGLADLVGADPLALDRPSAVTLVVRIVAGKVAVLDQAAAGMPALEMDDFELCRVSADDSGKLVIILCDARLGRSQLTWHMTARFPVGSGENALPGCCFGGI